ncbi:hypothetical protein [Streptomyces djakartensis]|uniref:hypothetical protein n=1 Tax=Streptomyces djakartensis TaxID=68193 RepID=UPI0034DDF0EC
MAEADLDRLRGADPAEPDHVVEVGAAHPQQGSGLLGSERSVGGDQVRQVLAAADLRDLVGVVQRPVRVRAQVDQQAAVDEPAHHEGRHVRLLADHVRGAEWVGDPVGRRAAADRWGGHRGPYGVGVACQSLVRGMAWAMRW